MQKQFVLPVATLIIVGLFFLLLISLSYNATGTFFFCLNGPVSLAGLSAFVWLATHIGRK